MKLLFRLIAILSISLCGLAISLAGQLKVYWVDVEGGAATLIITPAGESVLIVQDFQGSVIQVESIA